MLVAGKLQLRAHAKKGIERGTTRCRDWNRFRKFDNACCPSTAACFELNFRLSRRPWNFTKYASIYLFLLFNYYCLHQARRRARNFGCKLRIANGAAWGSNETENYRVCRLYFRPTFHAGIFFFFFF